MPRQIDPNDYEVYLLHANEVYRSESGKKEHSVRHYVGSTKRGNKRFLEHLRGAGAALTKVFLKNGGFKRARTWEGCGPDQEYYIKWQYKNLGRLCPICSGEAAYGRLPVEVLRTKRSSAEAVRKVRAKVRKSKPESEDHDYDW